MKATMRFITPEDANEVTESKKTSETLVNNEHKVDWPLTRKQQNVLRNTDNHKVSILLHPSLVFIKSCLYANSSLKKTSSMLETSSLKPLVNDGYLVAIPDGLVCRKSKMTVYIKVVPCDDEVSKETFIARLSSFCDDRFSYNAYLASCSTISFHSPGTISEEVLRILRLQRYQNLNIDMSFLVQKALHENQNENLSKTIIFCLCMEEKSVHLLSQVMVVL